MKKEEPKIIKPKYFTYEIKILLISLTVLTIIQLIISIITQNINYIIITSFFTLILIVSLIREFLRTKKLGIYLRNEDFTAKYTITTSSHFLGFGKKIYYKKLNAFTLRYDKIKEYGFISELKGNFYKSSKFDIGIIDTNNKRYHINIKNYYETEIIEFTKYIYKKTNIIPTGHLKDVL